MSTDHPATDVPTDDPPAARCAYCGRPFRDERLHDLHVGESHPGVCTDAEREAHEAARDDEEDELFMYHLKVIAAIALLWAGFVIVYMVVLGWQG